MSTGMKVAIASLVVALIGTAIALGAWLDPNVLGPHEASQAERAPYITQVDGLCMVAGRQVAALGVQPRSDPQAYGAYMESVARTLNQLLQSWAATAYPDGDRHRIRSMLDNLERVVIETGNLATAGHDANSQLADTLAEKVRDLMINLRQKTRAYGLQVCPHVWEN
jgi:hypothetical protein